MVQEYFIINSDRNKDKPDFYCFSDPIELRNKISQSLPKEFSKWEETNSNEEYFFQCFYKSAEADLKIEILKPQKSQPYIFRLEVLGGAEPLRKISELCKLNLWSVFDTKSLDYIDLNNLPFISVTEADKKKHYDEYWEKFNKAQEEEEQRKIDLEEEQQENRSYNDNSIERKFYKTPFGKVIFEEISNNKGLLSLKKLIDFPYEDFQKLKNDAKKGKAKVLSFYKYNLLKGINKDNKSMLYHDVTIFMPNLIILISIILAIFLKDWTFLLILPIKFVIGRLTTNSNDKPYLKYLAFTLFIASIYLFYLDHINISIIVLLSGVLLSSVLIARHQFNSAMTNLALINEEIFCYLIITDHIWLKTNKELYTYNVAKRIKDLTESLESEDRQ
jgi:hypothetical protein